MSAEAKGTLLAVGFVVTLIAGFALGISIMVACEPERFRPTGPMASPDEADWLVRQEIKHFPKHWHADLAGIVVSKDVKDCIDKSTNKEPLGCSLYCVPTMPPRFVGYVVQR